jgi:uncharacterized protein (TIGR03083 family)
MLSEGEMTNGAIEALTADRSELLEICTGLSDADWKADSGCAGWSVADVVAHLGALFWAVVDPSKLPDVTGLATERAQDVYVEARRSWTSEQLVADYESVSAQALVSLAGVEGQDFELMLGDLGTYPVCVLPNAFSFDHYTHIRADLFAPRGPLTGAPPPSDELRLVPAVDWIEAALPQQNGEQLAALGCAATIVVTGAASRTIRLGTGEPGAQITSDAAALVRWITQRSTWADEGVHATGDEQVLADIQSLHVF